MLPKKILINTYEPHPYHATMLDLGLRQFDLAHTIGMPQSTLSQMLRGIQPMPENVESEIKTILDGLKPEPAKKKYRKIIRPAKA